MKIIRNSIYQTKKFYEGKHMLLKITICALLLEFGQFETPVCSKTEKVSVVLDVANDFISKAKNLFPECDPKTWNCEEKKKSSLYLDAATTLMSEIKAMYAPQFSKQTEREKGVAMPVDSLIDQVISALGCEKKTIEEKPKDCSEILRSGKNKSGVYTIWPKSRFSSKKPLSVYCDMDTDGGGWTVIQRRGHFSTPKDFFYKDWKSYKNGFGNIEEEFWLGNDNIYAITSQDHTVIRFYLKDDKGNSAYAQYYTFWIEDEGSNYTLHIDHYRGTAGDAMHYINKCSFSTYDRDNDNNAGSCAVDRRGAWWYHGCTNSNLNGLNQPGVDDVKGITWKNWRVFVSLSETEIKLRPR